MTDSKYQVDDMVRILEPFNETFNDSYRITEIVINDGQQIVYVLGEHGGFVEEYLEKA